MSKRVKKIAVVVLTLLALLAMPLTAYAETACIVRGTRNYLALRTEPRTADWNEIGKLHNGDTFYVTDFGFNGNFAYGHTTYGSYGYVNQNYLVSAGSYREPTYREPARTGYGSPRTVTGTTNYLALRTSPVRSSSNEIGRLYNGQTFYVTEWGNTGFAYGYTAQGQYGYVVSAYLR